MLESEFQSKTIKQLEKLLPGCIVLKNDSSYIQGIPDLLVLYNKRWAMLECKKDKTAPYRPNQEFYLDKANRMSFSATIYPENKDEVLGILVQYLKGGNYEI
jgi:hypothetical protein